MNRDRDSFDLDGTLHVLRDNLARADALITAVENLIERPGDERDEDGDSPGRRRNHVAHLVESTKLAVRAAVQAGNDLDQHRVGT